jgi:predicted ATPase/DNA-binding CsgD family transcriptional regulator
LSATIAHNLPAQPTPFVGRHDELAEITRLLADTACHLLTLVGPGGIGKTRLALEAVTRVKDDFPDGVCFVSLAPVTSPTLLLSAICEALLLTLYGEKYMKLQLLSYLSSKRLLLVLDNYEHLLEDVDLLTEILAAVPHAKILITSRERLNLREEWVLELQGLPFPASDDETDIEDYSAVQLFLHTARRVNNAFSLSDGQKSAVTRICKLVGGMPLGIELAAAWVRALSCEQIAGEIERSLDILETPARNVPLRHRTMRAAFEPTWERLSDDERAVFMKLSVFRGGFTWEAAEYVAGAALRTLSALVDKSLLRTDINERYDLHELLRQYGEDKLLEAGEATVAAHRHLEYCLNLAEQAEAHLYSPQQEAWLDRLELELDNIRAALAWALRDEEVEKGLRLAGALGFFWEFRTHAHDGYEWLRRLLAIADDAPALLRAKALRFAGVMAIHVGDEEYYWAYCEESLALARAAGDPWSIAWALGTIGFYRWNDLSRTRLEEALTLFQEIGDEWGISQMLRRLGWTMLRLGDYEESRRLSEEALTRARAAEDKHATAWALLLLADATWCQSHDPRRTLPLLEESLSLDQEIRDRMHHADTLHLLGDVAIGQGDYDGAQKRYEESLALRQQVGVSRRIMASVVFGFGSLATRRGKPDQAARLFGAADAFCGGIDKLPLGRRVNLERETAPVRAQLGEEAFAQAWAAGQALTTEQAIAYALHINEPEVVQHRQPANQPLADPLTERELEILHLVAQGLSNREIARELVISLGTVKTHIHNICSKLDATSRTQAIARARDMNLI